MGQVVELLAHERTIGGQSFLPNVLQYVQEDLSHREQGEDKHPLSHGGGAHHTGKTIAGDCALRRSTSRGSKSRRHVPSSGGMLAGCGTSTVQHAQEHTEDVNKIN
jgi:hypothetical protein